MRTFILRARKGTTDAEYIDHLGTKHHVEVIAHTIANTFFISNQMREAVELYVILESTRDFPRTLRFYADPHLSFAGFHEQAILDVLRTALTEGANLLKDQSRSLSPGIDILGYGFEKLVKNLSQDHILYLLDKKGSDIREIEFDNHPVFILTDHLAMPKNTIKSLVRTGTKLLSLGPKRLFASQCVVLIHNELDRRLLI